MDWSATLLIRSFCNSAEVKKLWRSDSGHGGTFQPFCDAWPSRRLPKHGRPKRSKVIGPVTLKKLFCAKYGRNLSMSQVDTRRVLLWWLFIQDAQVQVYHPTISRPTRQGMYLYLSNSSPLNSIYTNAEGQALFKVRTPSNFFGRTTAVSRVVSNFSSRSENVTRRDYSLHDRFGQVAQFEWKFFRSSQLRFKGREVKTRAFFKKQGWGWHGRHRVFAGPDGREYKWLLNSAPELRLNNGGSTVVARYHSGQSNPFCKPRSAYLEILPAGERIVDTILVTFVYIEKLREDE